jgi:RNA polymerase sigma factor (sigma-70 family)
MRNGRFISDVDLLSQIRANDQQALLLLMKKYDSKLLRYIHSKTNALETAEEAVQDIFISLWNNSSQIVITESLSPYLYKAAKYKVIDYYTANSKKIIHAEALLPEYEHRAEPSAEDGVITAELNDWLTEEVDKMPDGLSKVFKLSRLEHLPVKEVAMQLSLSEQTVKNNLSIAVKRLHHRFKRVENMGMLLALAKLLYYFQ